MYKINLDNAGEPYLPSNGSEGIWFCDKFCDNCIHQHPDPDNKLQCDDILLQSLIGNQPKEWIYDNEGKPTCTAFVKFDWGKDDEGNWIDPEPPPPPEDPNQLCFPFDIIEILGSDYDLVVTSKYITERELV